MSSPSTPEPVDHACRSALQAMTAWLALPVAARAGVMRSIADALDARRADIIATTVAETALLESELAPEFARMTGTFRQFADAVERCTWHVPAIDHAQPAGAPGLVGPGHDIRRTLVPLGPVAVFGASNFPLAYGVCGGDSASALAAGCSVVVKEHPAHPRTGRLLHSVAATALASSSASHSSSLSRLLSYIPHEDPKDYSVAQQLVQHPVISAVGFTGSIVGGLAVERLARERTVPIPAFCEMGSVNPVFITPGAMDARGEKIADMLADAVLARFGQQCTCPGVVFFTKSAMSPAFPARLRERFKASTFRDMLAPWVRDGYNARINEIEDSGEAILNAFGEVIARGDPARNAQAYLWGTDLPRWNSTPVLREECFGPSTIFVMMPTWDDHATALLSGNLTLSIFFDDHDAADTARARSVLNHHARHAGRIILNGVPTGVRVVPGMVHSGPYPACNRPDTTAVGHHAIARWCRPVCYQNCPQALLPEELRDENAHGVTRLVDGMYKQTQSGKSSQ